MAEDAKVVQIALQVEAGEDADPDEIDHITRDLRREILEQDVEAADLQTEGPAPTGARSAEVVTLGALMLAVLPAALPNLIDFLRAWSLRREGRTVKVKVQVGDRTLDVEYNPATMSPDDLKDLLKTLQSTLTS